MLKNGELVMAGVVRGDCRDKMADSCQGLIGRPISAAILNCIR